MRNVVKGSEVAHLWAAQAQPSARNSTRNYYFEGATLYSYGPHFPVGKHIQGTRNRRAVLINSRSYSNTTSGHVSDARRAVSHLTTFHVPLTGNSSSDTPAGFLSYFKGAIASALELASRARGRKVEHFNTARHLADEHNRLAEFYGIRKRVSLPASLDDAIAAANAERAAADRRNAKAIAERDARRAAELERARAAVLAAVDDWRAGRVGIIPMAHLLPADILRVSADGQTVESSRGATVPVAHAMRAYRILRRLRDRGAVEWHSNGQSIPVGHYRVAQMAADRVIVGCHSFNWSEVQELANVHKWGRDPTTPTIGDIPPGLDIVQTPDDVAFVKGKIGPAAEGFDGFFVDRVNGEYAEVWGWSGTVPGLAIPAVRIIPATDTPAGWTTVETSTDTPAARPCPDCDGRGTYPLIPGERCFRCQGSGIIPAATTEGGAL